jgi:hypothetical protein
VAVVAAAGYAGWDRVLRQPGAYESPSSVELPPLPDDTAPTSDYLASGDGQLLLAVTTAVEPLLGDDASTSTCTTTIASLDGIGSPDQIFAAADGVPDRPTAEIATRYLAAITRFLGHCLEDGGLPSKDELQFTSTILTRRLESLG